MMGKKLRYLLLSCTVLLICFDLSHAEEPSIQIDVEGLKGDLLTNTRAALALPPGIIRHGRVETRWLERYIDKAPQRVDEALQPFGYYRSETVVRTEQLQEESYRVLVKVDPGPPTSVRSVQVSVTGEGREEQSLKRAIRDFPLKRGNPLDHRLYEQGKLDLRLEANDQGFLEAIFTSRAIRVDPDKGAADIELILDTGPRFYFGETHFDDDTERFDEDFLRRFLTYRRGEMFSHKELHRSRIRFYAANRFDEVLMVPLMEDVVDQQVPIKVTLVPGKQQRLRPGIGYGTNTGARVSLTYQNMQVGETPHAYLFNLSLAEKTQFLETSYTIPQDGGADNNLIGTLGWRRDDFNTYEADMIYAEVEETYGLGRGKVGSLFLRYLREDSNVGTEDNVAQLLIPGVRYYQRSYDDPLNPNSGYQFRLEARGSHDTLLSDVSIVQVIAAASVMLPLSRKLTLHPRLEGATTIKADELSAVPPSMRFFVGGDNSVRGYAYKSRGPRDEFGDVTGGDSLLVGSLEAEYALNEQWGLALFYDAGSAFKASSDMEVIQGAGFGVRRYTPIGPIKLDLAFRVGDDESGARIHLSVGFDI